MMLALKSYDDMLAWYCSVVVVKMCFEFFSFHLFWQRFFEPAKVERWAVVNFSARCDVRGLVRDLTRLGETKGIVCFINF